MYCSAPKGTVVEVMDKHGNIIFWVKPRKNLEVIRQYFSFNLDADVVKVMDEEGRVGLVYRSSVEFKD